MAALHVFGAKASSRFLRIVGKATITSRIAEADQEAS